ncbi:LB_137 family protein [Leptospira kobayashii]|uniref:LB_137 family protein n=1 Tax=Leptospira kobayashii TaxID=1917830 RepID=UPI000D59B65C|nr:hypothetical protein [Leptospira kobayashii]
MTGIPNIHSSRKNNKGIVFSLLFLLSVLPSFADKLKLKSGEIRNGRVLTVTTTQLEWQEEGKVSKYPLQEVIGVEVGYDGIPFCMETKPWGKERCDLFLHKLNSEKISFSYQESPLQLESLPVPLIESLNIRNVPGQEIIRFLEQGTSGFWKSKNFSGFAGLKSFKENRLELISNEKDKKTVIVELENFETFSIPKKNKVKEFLTTNSVKLIPGYKPFTEKKYGKSTLIFGTAALSALGMIYEYNQSVQAINGSQEFIPGSDGRVYVVSNVLSTDRYDFHNQRFQMYSGILVAVLAYSLFDNFYIGQVESKDGNTGSVWLKADAKAGVISQNRGYGGAASKEQIQYTLEVESRF